MIQANHKLFRAVGLSIVLTLVIVLGFSLFKTSTTDKTLRSILVIGDSTLLGPSLTDHLTNSLDYHFILERRQRMAPSSQVTSIVDFNSIMELKMTIIGVIVLDTFEWIGRREVERVLQEQKPNWVLLATSSSRSEFSHLLDGYRNLVLKFSHVLGTHLDDLVYNMVRNALSDLPIHIEGASTRVVFMNDVLKWIVKSVHDLEDERHLSQLPHSIGEETSWEFMARHIVNMTHSHSKIYVHPVSNSKPNSHQPINTSITNNLNSIIYTMLQHSLDYLKNLQHDCQLGGPPIQINNLFNCTVSIQSGISTVKNNELQDTRPVGNNMLIVKSVGKDSLELEELSTRKIYRMEHVSFYPKTRSFQVVNFVNENDTKLYGDEHFTLHVHCCPSVDNPVWEWGMFSPHFIRNRRSEYLGSICSRVLQGENYVKMLLSGLSENEVFIEEHEKQHVCDNDCNYPGICIQTGKCRCVAEPFCAKFIENSQKPNRTSVLTRVGKMIGKSWPKIHVVTTNFFDYYISSARCDDRDTTFRASLSMDDKLLTAFESISVPAQEAEIVIVPYYQGCLRLFNLQLLDVLGNIVNDFKKEYPNFRGKFVTFASHDFGACDVFPTSYFGINPEMDQPKQFQDMVIIQANGDYHMNCYKPHKDIVAPPRAFLTNDLLSNFEQVKPSNERKYLMFFEGAVWGTGYPTRETFKTCHPLRRELKMKEENYMLQLNETRYCPTVAGFVGWSYRTSDIIYAGCIPVFVTEYLHPPFHQLIDYSQFSIWVNPLHVHRLQEILESIPIEQALRMQEKLLIVRDVFMYRPTRQVDEWTPHDFVLRELYLHSLP